MYMYVFDLDISRFFYTCVWYMLYVGEKFVTID